MKEIILCILQNQFVINYLTSLAKPMNKLKNKQNNPYKFHLNHQHDFILTIDENICQLLHCFISIQIILETGQ